MEPSHSAFFEEVITLINEIKTLAHQHHEKQLMSTDASDYCMGCCIIQTKPNFNYNDRKKLTPKDYESISSFSKILDKTQREFNTIGKEL
jgi:hypothetical protein